MSTLAVVELFGVITALLYLVLVTYEKRICWLFYIASSILFIPIFWSASLYADAALQLYFVGMGIYAAVTWGNPTKVVVIRRIGIKSSLQVATEIIVSGLFLGYFLHYTDAGNFAYFDGIICTGSIITTIFTARKILEGWYFWIAINVLATVVFALKSLDYTVWLYALYAILSVKALIEWSRSLKSEEEAT